MSEVSQPVVVVAHWHVVESQVDTVLALLPELRQLTLAEAGCAGYEVLRSLDAPATLVLIERYRDEAAIAAHRASPHYQEIVAGRIAPLLASREVEILRPQRG
ncbi:MAG TPA: putative quinol monooxygenase [Stenotrophomonas sp.]|nr:putative quinol monooxygenase [Stenotrophomonas sp.]